MASAAALARVAPDKQLAAAVASLIRDLKDSDVLTRVLATDALAEIGPRARTAAPALEAALKDSEAEVGKAAARALQAMK